MAATEYDRWWQEYHQLDAELKEFDTPIRKKVEGNAPLSLEEQAFVDAYVFWGAVLLGSGDIFHFVPHVLNIRGTLEAIGAKGCVAAAEKLLPLHQRLESLPESETSALWRDCRDELKAEIKQGNDLAEDPFVFARKLIAFCKTKFSTP